MIRLFTICALLFVTLYATPARAAGSYNYQPSASKLVNEAKKLIKKEKYKRAIGKLEKAKRDEPDNADIFNYLGFAHRKMGAYAQSQSYYRQALDLDPGHKLALEYQGELYLTLDDLASAEANLAKLRALCPDGCDALDDLTLAINAYRRGLKEQ